MAFVLAFALTVRAQPLDWSHDLTVFGANDDEKRPALILSPSSPHVRVLCARNDSCASSKVSEDRGASFGAPADWCSAGTRVRIAGTADAMYHYVFLRQEASSLKTLLRFSPASNAFASAHAVEIATQRTAPVLALTVMTDAVYQPGDPYLNVCWVERTAPGQRAVWFAQSQNCAQSFLPEIELVSFPSPDSLDAVPAMCASWQGESEALIVAAPVDRPGSIPEQIRLFRSTNQGQAWTALAAPDAGAYSQTEPALAGWGTTVLLAYCTAEPFQTCDIRLAFSLDGGLSFSEPQPVVTGADDDRSPILLTDNSGLSYHLVYLSGSRAADSATVFIRSGPLSQPWQLGESVAICDPGTAVLSGGLSAAVCDAGVAIAWTSRFATGDCDVRFDGSWRGSDVPRRSSVTITGVEIEMVYPNPVNSMATIRLASERAALVELVVTDMLGRIAATRSVSIAAAGGQLVPFDLRDLPSGDYFVTLGAKNATARRIVLVR